LATAAATAAGTIATAFAFTVSTICSAGIARSALVGLTGTKLSATTPAAATGGYSQNYSVYRNN
jgi:hypothetical protein